MKAGKLDQALLTLSGLTLVGAGGLTLAAGLSPRALFGRVVTQQPVLTPQVQRMLAMRDTWVWGITAGVSVVLVAVGLLWLLYQVSTDSIGRLELEPDRGSGRVRMHSDALGEAVSREARQAHGVEAAAARIVNTRSTPELHLELRLNPRASFGETRNHVENVALPHAREVVDPDPLPSLIRFQLARGRSDRVR